MSNEVIRYVVCAALRVDETIVVGPRHYDATMRETILNLKENKDWSKAEQGFVDQFGIFMNRKEAWHVAEKASQIRFRKPGMMGPKLYSENLY